MCIGETLKSHKFYEISQEVDGFTSCRWLVGHHLEGDTSLLHGSMCHGLSPRSGSVRQEFAEAAPGMRAKMWIIITHRELTR